MCLHVHVYAVLIVGMSKIATEEPTLYFQRVRIRYNSLVLRDYV